MSSLSESSTPYLPGAASLADYLDKKLAVLLQDGRYLVGVLRTYDQYLNLVLHRTIERLIFQEFYSETEIGLYVVRGDNIVLFGEVDEVSPLSLTLISSHELHEKVRSSQPAKRSADLELE
eukprot:gene6384-7038_t